METAEEKAARLAEALRANLRRRKAQAREIASDDAPAPGSSVSATCGGTGVGE